MVTLEGNVGVLQKGLGAAEVLVDTTTIEFGREGIIIDTVEPSNVASVDLNIRPGPFDRFETTGEELNMSLNRLLNVIEQFDREQTITLNDNSEKGVVEISIGSYEFELGLLHPNSIESGNKPSEIDLPSGVTLEAGQLINAVETAELFSEALILGIDNKREVFYINSIGDVDTMSVAFSNEDEEVEIYDINRAHSVFSLDYLDDIITHIPPSEQVNIRLGREQPAKINFKLPDINCEVEYGLAPRLKG